MKQVKGCLLSIVLWLCSSVISAHAQDTRLNSIEAMTVAQHVAASHPDANLAQGIHHAAQALTKPKPVKTKSKRGNVIELPVDRFDSRPKDYRRAIAHAQANNVLVLRQLKDLGMAPMLEDIIDI